MKTFFKVLLLVVAVIVAIKLLPATLALGCALVFGLAIAATVGVSLLAVGVVLGLALLVLFAPIWLPIMLLVGLILLIRRLVSPRA